MLARHHGQVVLVWGAIPGERVARASSGRRRASRSPRRSRCCRRRRIGGPSLAMALRRKRARARRLRAAARAQRRDHPRRVRPDRTGAARSRSRRHGVARARLPDARAPARGERPARLLPRGDPRTVRCRSRPGSCSNRPTRGLPPHRRRCAAGRRVGVTAVEIAENIAGDQRACHLDLREGADPSRSPRSRAGWWG